MLSEMDYLRGEALTGKRLIGSERVLTIDELIDAVDAGMAIEDSSL